MKEAWPHKTHFSCHDNGWIVFRFETKEMMEDIKKGNYEVFGIPLILTYLPQDFRFDTTPVFKYRVWATFPNLPLALWNPSALGKLASLIGEPIAVDHKTMARNHIDGPRVQVLVDPARRPLYGVNLSLHNGTKFEQKIIYDYYPIFCSTCSRVGHVSENCRMTDRIGPGSRPRRAGERPQAPKQTDGQVKGGTKARSKSRPNRGARSRSRRGRSTAKKEAGGGGKAPTSIALNTHTYFQSPESSQAGMDREPELSISAAAQAAIAQAEIIPSSDQARKLADMVGPENEVDSTKALEKGLIAEETGSSTSSRPKQTVDLEHSSDPIESAGPTSSQIAELMKVNNTNVEETGQEVPETATGGSLLANDEILESWEDIASDSTTGLDSTTSEFVPDSYDSQALASNVKNIGSKTLPPRGTKMKEIPRSKLKDPAKQQTQQQLMEYKKRLMNGPSEMGATSNNSSKS